MQWGQSDPRDRAASGPRAFAALFEYFAPRIKAFMQRSGASEASAEELAQETMLAVWRKAALFDPASAGAAAWIFTIARNLRIDAHRRERRGGVIETSDVEIEFQIDDAPQPDARLATAQSEERVRSALSKLSADQMRVVELVVLRGEGARGNCANSGNSTGHGQVKAALGHEPTSQSAE